MDTTLLEVVLGLALVYAVLAVLVMKLQEEVGGNLLNYRANVLHDMVAEACGGSGDLKEQVLAHPLLHALHRSDAARQRSVLRDSGPSAIPPPLFAKALLAVLNGGAAPSLAHGNPALFLAAAAPRPDAGAAGRKAAEAGDGRQRVWQVLWTLLPGHEADWPGFEAALAQWFSDIGDRADGWFKRKASRWALVVSALLVGALNVDSFHIANTLAQDPALRLGLADLAARIDGQRRADADGKPDATAPASAAAQPMQQLASRMTDAITRLNSAFRSDEAIGRYAADLAPLHAACSIVREDSALDALHSPTAETRSAVQALAASAAATAQDKARRGRAPDVVGGVLSLSASLSNADIWLRVLPVLQAKAEVAQLLPAADAERTWRRSFECVSQLSSWVRSATVVSNKAEVRAQMQDAAAALESVKSALLALLAQQPAAVPLQRAFLNDPQAFVACQQGAANRSAFDTCLQRALRSGINLPLFWGGAAMRHQFCRPDTRLPPAKDAPEASLLCEGSSSAANVKLDLPALRLVPRDGWPWLAAGGGWLVTVLFVALGAPFWFDLLGKVTRLRSAGTVRDATADEARGRGALPPPPPSGNGTGGGKDSGGGGADGPAPFSDSRTPFEDTLTPAAILRLQQRLPAAQTGRLDGQTRAALRSWCAANGATVTEVLDEALYLRIVGRATAPVATGTASARLALGQAGPQVQALAAALTPVLRQTGRIDPGQTRFDADVRALAVLYRYHSQRRDGLAAKDCPVLRLPDSNPALLDEVDEALAASMLEAARLQQRITLEPPCWMDWAIGELGQIEHDGRSRAASNQRICDYLDTASPGRGDDGDHTAWCGAFVAWVLKRYDEHRQAYRHDAKRQDDNERQGDPLSAAGAPAMPTVANANWPLRADSWADWGTPHADWPNQAGFGDVVLFKPQGRDSSGHVGFVVAVDGAKVWTLGGNQSGGSRVSVQAWPASQVVQVMAWAPALPAQPAG